jgi:serine/threonine protein kinase
MVGERLDQGVKLIDFGLSATCERNGLLRDWCGTRGFIAPELNDGYAYNEKVDTYSCGIVLLSLLTNTTSYVHHP